MRLHTAGQRAQVVTPFEAAHDAALRVALRHFLDALGDPDVVLFHQPELAHVVFAVGVKPGADEDHLWLVGVQPGHPHHVDQLADVHALGVGRHRQVHQVGRGRVVPGGVIRVLVKAAHQDAVVAGHDVFGAVAVVHVKVDDRHAFQAVALQRVFGGHRHVVHKAEAHGLVACGVVARWAHGAKSVHHFAGHDGVGGVNGSACRHQNRVPAVDVDGRVGVDLGVAGSAGGDLVAQAVAQAPQ